MNGNSIILSHLCIKNINHINPVGKKNLSTHLVKFINADHASIGQYHSSTLHDEITLKQVLLKLDSSTKSYDSHMTYRGGVPHDGGSETGCTAPLARCVYSNWSHLLHKFEQLALGRAGVA